MLTAVMMECFNNYMANGDKSLQDLLGEARSQHEEDAAAVLGAKKELDAHLEEVRSGIGDLKKNPGVFDEASKDYETETRQRIVKLLSDRNYGEVARLASGLASHFRGVEESISSIESEEQKALWTVRMAIFRTLAAGASPGNLVSESPLNSEGRDEIWKVVSPLVARFLRDNRVTPNCFRIWYDKGTTYTYSDRVTGEMLAITTDGQAANPDHMDPAVAASFIKTPEYQARKELERLGIVVPNISISYYPPNVKGRGSLESTGKFVYLSI